MKTPGKNAALRAVGAAACVLLLVGCGLQVRLQEAGGKEAAGGTSVSLSRGSAGEGETVPLSQAVKTLKVAEENHAGYDRDLFDLYQDAGNDCDARRVVLFEEAIEKPEVVQPGCKLRGGKWFSYYDGKTLNDARDVSIDHMVPLAEAWRSGARNWSKDQLVKYGSDLEYSPTLVGVTKSSNSSKGDKDPAEWLPPRKAATCQYIQDWVGTKLHWGLTVDDDELEAIVRYVNEKHGTCQRGEVLIS